MESNEFRLVVGGNGAPPSYRCSGLERKVIAWKPRRVREDRLPSAESEEANRPPHAPTRHSGEMLTRFPCTTALRSAPQAVLSRLSAKSKVTFGSSGLSYSKFFT